MNSTIPGSAPYHFIDLNENVLSSNNQTNNYSNYQLELNSGYILTEIEAITELFTRGKNQNFKTVNGKPVFVGSSIRGPVRVLAEQMGYAQMQDVEKEEAFFFRSFENSNKGRLYRRIMTPNSIKAGWLVYEKGEFKLKKAKPFTQHENGLRYPVKRSILFFSHKDQDEDYTNHSRITFDKFKIFVRNGKEVRNSKSYCIQLNSNAKNKNVGVLMQSGEMGSKKKDIIIGLKSDDLVISGKKLLTVISKIENDKNRLKEFSRTQIMDSDIPCFYIGDKNNVEAIGFNLFFRFPYVKNVGDAIDQKKETEQLDFASSIFGDQDPENRSKVFFEDFYTEEGTKAKDEQYPHILAEPKASYYPYYLKSDQFGNNNTWNGDSISISGYKNYQHRTEKDLWIKNKFKVGESFTNKHKSYADNVKNFEKHHFIHLLVEFDFYHKHNNSQEELENYITDEQIEYKTPKIELTKEGGLKSTRYYLELKTKAQLDFFNKQSNMNYRLFYVNAPVTELKKITGFDYLTEEQKEKKEKDTLDSKPIRVMPRGTKFKGRIRFENLSDAELGLLLLSLDLPVGHAHKIGMGKPIGLGSARFTNRLFLSNRKARYEKVFDGSIWNKSISEIHVINERDNQKSKQDFITAFKTYFKKELNANWSEQTRIQNLYYLLKVDGKDTAAWSETTRYLEMDGRKGNEFADKRRLKPIPSPAKKKAEKTTSPPVQKRARVFRDPETVPHYDFETLNLGNEVIGVLTKPKEVKIKLDQGIQHIQLVIPKGEPMHDFKVGEVVDVIIKQVSKKSQKIIQVSLKN